MLTSIAYLYQLSLFDTINPTSSATDADKKSNDKLKIVFFLEEKMCNNFLTLGQSTQNRHI